MVSLDAALDTILTTAQCLEPVGVPLAEAVGLVLAEDVASDVDMPPFDKSAMDGFAVIASDLAELPRTLSIVEEIPAGAVPAKSLRPGQCARIMTGAPLPDGADAVVRVEDTQPGTGPNDVVVCKGVSRHVNICFRAEDVARGDVVLRAGHVIRVLDVATLAACGCARVPVHRRPSVAIVSTGNEVVPVEREPEAGQIRDANGPYVSARLRALGIEARYLGIARDTVESLRRALRTGLRRDVLVVSGGVSAGDFDLVPGVLAKLGVEVLFDSVAMQPGRPTFFGRCDNCLVFGLPGNPVSVMTVTELLVVPAIKKMQGYAEVGPPRRSARLLEAASHRPGRTAHIPGVAEEAADGWTARPVPYHGSAHTHALTRANCLIVLPADVATLEPTAAAEVVLLPGIP